MRLQRLHAVSFALLCSSPAVLGGQVQKPGLTLPTDYDAKTQQDAVKGIFTDSYQAYRKFAFGHDELSPLSQNFSDPRNGWGASIVDGMSTMSIMGLNDFLNEALNFTQSIDFTKSQTSDPVSLFETTIRYVAGLISTYELTGKQHKFLIDKATVLADKLTIAWSKGNTIPYNNLDFSKNEPAIETTGIAGAGTLTLEFDRLSTYTGNDTYRKLAVDTVKFIAGLPTPLPGLPAQGLAPQNGTSIGGYVTWGGGSDSYFEYLIKYARLTNTDDNLFADSWYTAVDSSIKTLAKTSTVGDHLYLADFDENRKIRHVGSHLECFHAGNWLLGGKLMNNDTIVDIALRLNDACWNTYQGDATGIGPEAFAFISSDGDFTGPGNVVSAADRAFYEKHGYYITAADYIQRPEVLESNFYAWRVTGDKKYLDRAASAIASFKKYLSTPTGYAGINDVNDVNTSKIDDTESFWFAEVLKYLYLTFDDPNKISLDNYVFNTEAHPFTAPAAKPTYGSPTIAPPTNTKPFVVISGPLPAISADVHLPKQLKDIFGL